ncbi:MAG TPA: tetratricopeptide repeat protein [Pyrinomonadaceae bacterium]
MLSPSHSFFLRVLKSLFVLAVCVGLGVIDCNAQSGGGVDSTGTGGRHTIQGRIYFPSGRRTDVRVKVKLYSTNSGELTVFSDSNGTFSFRGLDAGSYTVIVDAGDEYEQARESIYIEPQANMPRLGITLPPVARLYTVDISLRLKQEVYMKAGVVSAVLAAVPEQARDLYLKAVASSEAGDTAKAIDQLKAALNVHPEFPLALNELGIQYLRTNQAEKAAEVLSKAVKLAPDDFQPRLNYGIALLNQHKLSEAEDQLRVAVNKENTAPTAHMYLGISLAIQRKLDEGEKELNLAVASKSPEVPLAHRYLSGIYYERRKYGEAANELETYLKLVPKAPDAVVLREKIQEMRKKQ